MLSTQQLAVVTARADNQVYTLFLLHPNPDGKFEVSLQSQLDLFPNHAHYSGVHLEFTNLHTLLAYPLLKPSDQLVDADLAWRSGRAPGADRWWRT